MLFGSLQTSTSGSRANQSLENFLLASNSQALTSGSHCGKRRKFFCQLVYTILISLGDIEQGFEDAPL